MLYVLAPTFTGGFEFALLNAPSDTTPTEQAYGTLESAYAHFNQALFGGRLPTCLITVQRCRKAYGYFSGDRFGRVGGQETTDEIAMNPAYFNRRPIRDILSTLAHEMAHVWRHHHGKPPRGGYHDRLWAAKMREIGLIPSDTGAPGGQVTGQRVSHYIEENGPFDTACAAWLEQNPGAPLYHDRAGVGDDAARKKTARKKRASKTKYTCPACEAAAWGRPALHLICGGCGDRMRAESQDDDED